MKNLFIVGPPRCGKTTLAQMIADKYPCEIIRGDCLEKIIYQSLIQDRLHESLKTEDSVLSYPVLEDKDKIALYQQMYEQIKTDLRGKEKLIIIEAHNLSFFKLEHEFGKDFEFYCLGMPSIITKELCNYIRLNDDMHDWTNRIGSTSLEECCTAIIESSRKCRNTLKYFPKIKFFDTSGNRRQKLELILEDIEKNIIQV